MLGALVAVAALCAFGTLAGAVWFVAAIFRDLDDYRPKSRHAELTLALVAASLTLSLRAGWVVGRDWYFAGRDASR